MSSMSTVHAPHSARSQPSFVPVSHRSGSSPRRGHGRGCRRPASLRLDVMVELVLRDPDALTWLTAADAVRWVEA